MCSTHHEVSHYGEKGENRKDDGDDDLLGDIVGRRRWSFEDGRDRRRDIEVRGGEACIF